jgi:hypothetical protein
MERLLTQVDDNIGKARTLSPPPGPRRRSPVQPDPPTHAIRQIQYHDPVDGLAQQGSPFRTEAPGNTHPAHICGASQQLEGDNCTAAAVHYDSGQTGMLSCSQYLQQVRYPGQRRSPGRREKYGVRPRVSASEVVPPERVAEEDLRTTRIQYFADLQRLQQKRLQSADRMR